jgi:hypothetical protein
MAQKKSDFRRGWGKMTVIVNAVIDAILAAGGDDDDVARLEMLAPEIAALSIAARPPQPETETVEEQPKPKEEVEVLGWIELDPAVSFQERMRLCDFKGGVHPNITADKSKLKCKVRRLIVLYDPRGSVSTEEMKRRMTENGDKPCDIDDGTGIGKTFPQRQVANPLPLLDGGSVCLDDRRDQCAPVLNYWGALREFRLDRLAGDWDGNCRFPAVREEEFLDT